MIRGPDGRFKAVTWRDVLAMVAEFAHQVKPEEVVGIAGRLSDAESMMALKDFLNRMGSDKVSCEGNGASPNADLRPSYLLNTSIAGLEQADVLLLVGTQVVNVCLFHFHGNEVIIIIPNFQIILASFQSCILFL